jgi:hypothetical protein
LLGDAQESWTIAIDEDGLGAAVMLAADGDPTAVRRAAAGGLAQRIASAAWTEGLQVRVALPGGGRTLTVRALAGGEAARVQG